MSGTVLVTAVGSFSAAAVIRGCREMGFGVLGCDIYPAEWIAASMETDLFFRSPPAADRDAYLDFLARICAERGVDYLVPLTDAEVDAVNEYRGGTLAGERFLPGVTVCLPPVRTVALCRDKWRMNRFLEDGRLCAVIPTRRLSELIASEEDTGYELISYPLILKPDNGRSSQGLVRVHDAGQMSYEADRLRVLADFYLAQPAIEGNVVTVDVVRSSVTGQVRCLAREELLRTPNGAGTSVRVFRDEALESGCGRIARALDIRGCVNFEFIEESPGKRYFLECNPRFSGGVAFSRMAGYDMVGNHLRCFTGESLEPMGEIRTQYLVKRYAEYRTRMEEM